MRPAPPRPTRKAGKAAFRLRALKTVSRADPWEERRFQGDMPPGAPANGHKQFETATGRRRWWAAGNDSIDGRRAPTLRRWVPATTTFVWDPGDGSDTVEGQDGAEDDAPQRREHR